MDKTLPADSYPLSAKEYKIIETMIEALKIAVEYDAIIVIKPVIETMRLVWDSVDGDSGFVRGADVRSIIMLCSVIISLVDEKRAAIHKLRIVLRDRLETLAPNE